MTTLWIAATLTGILAARLFCGDWFNHLSLLSAAYGSGLILLDGGLLSPAPIAGENRFYLFCGWAFLYLGGLIVSLLRGRTTANAAASPAWHRAYLCRLPTSRLAQNLRSNPGWQLFVLLLLQAILLGASDEFDVGKVVFAAVYLLLLVSWIPRILAQSFSYREPLIGWTVGLLALAVFSRLPGAQAGVSTSDWMRDLLPLLHFSWILIGPFAFSSRESIWKGYLLFLAIDVLLTVLITNQFILERGFRAEGLELTGFLRATDVVVLFGTFMTAPMTALPISPRYRTAFGLLAAAFVGAALVTGTRSHIGAILAGLLMFFWLAKASGQEARSSARRAVLASVLVGVAAFGIALQTGALDSARVLKRAQEVEGLDFGALTQRIDESLAAWEGFRERPLFGQGLGYKMRASLWSNDITGNDLYMVHNFYMYVPLKFGMLGVAIFFGFLLSLVRTAVSTYRQAQQPFDKAFAAGVASLLVALLVESATAPRFEDRSATALLAILIALLLSIRRRIAAQGAIPLRVSMSSVPGSSPA